jgi:hypothetical protein
MYLDSENNYPIVAVDAPGLAVTGADAASLALRTKGILLSSIADPLSGQDGGFIYPLNYYYRTNAAGSAYILTFCLETNSVLGHFQGCGNLENY